ncbi:MAG: proton-conducting membrane transporter [Lachnospiraceae bacterium]|nr:proton-conducting membrane transporter [Lachnospiraceae bacterium]
MPAYMILVPILIPILTGAGMLLFPFRDARIRNIFVEIMVVITTAFCLLLLTSPPKEALNLFSLGENLVMTLRVDGMAIFFGGIVSCLWPLATLYTFEYMRHEERVNTFLAFYTITYGTTLGVAFAGNIFCMYLFYEALTLVTLPLCIHTLTPQAKSATRKYLYYMIGGTAFAFIGMVFYALYSLNFDFVYGGSLDLVRIATHKDVVLLIYVLAFFGFGVKAAVFPFHGWLPSISVAPTPVTALLHAVAVVKSGIFAIMRLTVYCFGMDYLRGTWAQAVVLIFGMLTIIHASTMGVREPHLKRRLAYSTVSNLSYMIVGLGTMTPLGFYAAMAHMLFHAVMKISGFFCIGAVMHQTNKNYIYEIDGLGYRMPITFGALFVSSLSLIGIPLFSGFVSKWMLADALFEGGGLLEEVAVWALMYSALMTAIYLLSIAIRAFFPEKGSNWGAMREFTDPNLCMTIPLSVFSLVTVFFGVHSGQILRLLEQISRGVM